MLGKSVSENFKTKQRRASSPDELMIFPDTHEAIIEQDTWNIAQKLRSKKKPRVANAEDVNEALKAANQMLWVQSMNSIRNRAEEIIKQGLIYC